MRIGLDFDGVISDCGRLKSEGAKSIYGVDIPPERFKKELVIDKGILTLEQYRNLQEKIYGNRDIGLSMSVVEGALDFISKLQNDGHELIIITSRDDSGLVIAREWMQMWGLELQIIGVGGGKSKAGACIGLDVYVDDDLDKLEPLVNIVPYRFLFSWGYNEHINVPEFVAKRIKSWQDFYQEISNLSLR